MGKGGGEGERVRKGEGCRAAWCSSYAGIETNELTEGKFDASVRPLGARDTRSRRFINIKARCGGWNMSDPVHCLSVLFTHARRPLAFAPAAVSCSSPFSRCLARTCMTLCFVRSDSKGRRPRDKICLPFKKPTVHSDTSMPAFRYVLITAQPLSVGASL